MLTYQLEKFLNFKKFLRYSRQDFDI